MDYPLFEQEIDRWCVAARAECLRLHNDGVPAENCLSIATAIAHAKAMKRAVDRQQLMQPAPPFPRVLPRA